MRQALTKEQRDLVERNIRLALKAANEAARLMHFRVGADPAYSLDDLVSIAYYGLCLAAQRFRPEFGFRFSTYAMPYIRGIIRNELRGTWAGGIRVPRNLEVTLYPAVSSSDAPVPVGADDGILVEVRSIGSPEDDAVLAVDLLRLPEKESVVVRLYAAGYTQREIARKIGCSQSTVGRLLRQGLFGLLGRWSGGRLGRSRTHQSRRSRVTHA